MTGLPFGAAELVAGVAGARRVLDAGCGSGRPSVAIALAGASVTGFDTNAAQLEVARGRAAEVGADVTLVEADFNGPLPFADGAFDAVVSRLSLMTADDPAATLRELRRVLVPRGRVMTLVWASPTENPWFGQPREAIATVLGTERAAFARVFGRIGTPESAAAVHEEAGLVDVEARYLRGVREAPDVTSYWRELSEENGHFGRVARSLDDDQTAQLESEIARRLEPWQVGDRLVLPRTLVLVSARR